MTQAEKKALWDELKAAGWQPTKHYREYKTEDLQAGVSRLRAGQRQATQEQINVAPQPAVEPDLAPDWKAQLSAQMSQPEQPAPEPDEIAGLRTNTHGADDPLRIEPNGRIVYQDEVRKSAYPKPRGRRVLKYNDPGVEKRTVSNGEYTESFEMPGTQGTRPAEAKITMPSFQTAIYRDPGMPFRTHEYNGQRGFDLFEVEKYFGGADLVPEGVKRIYVSNTLCYDIRTVIRAIESEARRRGILKGI